MVDSVSRCRNPVGWGRRGDGAEVGSRSRMMKGVGSWRDSYPRSYAVGEEIPCSTQHFYTARDGRKKKWGCGFESPGESDIKRASTDPCALCEAMRRQRQLYVLYCAGRQPLAYIG